MYESYLYRLVKDRQGRGNSLTRKSPWRLHADTPRRRHADTFLPTPTRPDADTPIRFFPRRYVSAHALHSAWMAHHKLVGWAAAGQPLWPVFTCAVAGVEAQTGDDQK
jgi:hypothetical protein